MATFTRAVPPLLPPEKARFWSQVARTSRDDDECWVWLGNKNSAGYGRFRVDGRMRPAHRVAYEWQYGEIPAIFLMQHRCDNPPCVRPEHLEPGTHYTNALDRHIKGRDASGDSNGSRTHPEKRTRGNAHWWHHGNEPEHAVGILNGRAKLSEQDVRAIRAKASTASNRSIAREFAVSAVLIGKIINRKLWKHLED